MRKWMYPVVLLVVLALACAATAESTEGSSGLGSTDWGSFGSLQMPEMNGFGNNDWFENFSMPEGFGSVDWSKFGSTTDGGAWGSLNNSTMDEWASKFDSFKNDMLGTGTGNIGGNTSSDSLNALKDAFDSRVNSTTGGSGSSNDLRSLFAERFGSDKSYKEADGMPGLPVTADQLKEENSLKGAYDSFSGTLVGGKLSAIENSFNSTQNKSSSIIEQNLSAQLTDFGSMSAYQRPEGTNIRGMFESNSASMGSKVMSVDPNSYINAGKILHSSLYSSGRGMVDNAKSLYNPYVGR